jgi:enoyl-CoA hydratase
MSDVLLVEKKEEASLPYELWTINRPDKLNAINSTVIDRLQEEGTRLKNQLNLDLLSCRFLILQGAGEKAFVAGADISEMNDFKREQAKNFSLKGQAAFGSLEKIPIPTIAAIRGFALGGGLELAMCCDVLVADAASQFGQPEAFLGLIPGFGATARFLDRVGIAKGLELLFSGRRISSEEALKLGLVQQLSGDKTPLARALELGVEMSTKTGPLAARFLKEIALQLRMERFEKTLALEARYFGEVFESADKKEGVSAFLEKRKALFSGT